MATSATIYHSIRHRVPQSGIEGGYHNPRVGSNYVSKLPGPVNSHIGHDISIFSLHFTDSGTSICQYCS